MLSSVGVQRKVEPKIMSVYQFLLREEWCNAKQFGRKGSYIDMIYAWMSMKFVPTDEVTNLECCFKERQFEVMPREIGAVDKRETNMER